MKVTDMEVEDVTQMLKTICEEKFGPLSNDRSYLIDRVSKKQVKEIILAEVEKVNAKLAKLKYLNTVLAIEEISGRTFIHFLET